MRKSENVDIFKEMYALVRKYTKLYQSDFDIDRGTLLRAVKEPGIQNNAMIWLCRRCGTWLLSEQEAYIQDTVANTTIQYYAHQEVDEVCAVRVIEPKTIVDGIIYGNTYDVNFKKLAGKIEAEAVLPQAEHFIFKDGCQYDIAFTNKMPSATLLTLIEQHGPVVARTTLPADMDAYNKILYRNQQERASAHVRTASYMK